MEVPGSVGKAELVFAFYVLALTAPLSTHDWP